jgi:hypothetical protein
VISQADQIDIVAALPRRCAHATYALVAASRARNMPLTAGEVVIFDEEASSAVATGAALRHAQRRGLAVYTGKYWLPTNLALELRTALEDRYLAEVDY